MNLTLSILLLTPLLAAALILVVPRSMIRPVALLASLVGLGCAVTLHAACLIGSEVVPVDILIPWVPSLGLNLHLGVDTLSLPMLLLTTIVSLAAVLAERGMERTREFYFHLLVVMGASLAAFCSRNLFFFYLFCEVTTIPKYLLTAVWGRLPAGKYRTDTRFAAMQVTLYIAAGAMIVLIALSILYYVCGREMDLALIGAKLASAPIDAGVQTILFGLLLLGFGIWSSMWPFHSWSPLTYAALPAPAAMLFAGVVKNFGVYGLLRIGIEVLPHGAANLAQPLAAIAVINILYGGFVAMRQTDWNYIISYSSISHMGYLLLALAAVFSTGSSAAVQAVLFFMFAHGVVVALFFVLSGHLQETTGSRFVNDHGGLAKVKPATAVAFSLAVIAGSGLPGFANFVAEIMVFVVAWSEGSLVFRIGAIAAAWGIVMTATYLFRALRSTFHGELRPYPSLVRPASSLVALRLAVVLLVITSVGIGVWPRLLTDLRPAPLEKVDAP